MVKFRQKDFSIREGHYTGPKDMDKVPGALEVVGKSALVGSGIGAVIGGTLEDSSVLSGATKGGKYGTITGILLKIFLNYLHNPMSTIKYQEVDKLIRREYGIYRISGITVGDTIEKRGSVDEKFSFNDREVTKYKLCFSIQNNAITMYTFRMTDDELDKVSNVLDYYCKKYFGMEYTSKVLNERTNSYSVSIVFTNYQVIANFIIELSNKLNVKINLLDNKALAENRFRQKIEEEGNSEKTFSSENYLSKYDLFKIIGGYSIPNSINSLVKGDWKSSVSDFMIGLIIGSLEKMSADELSKIQGVSISRKYFNNSFLISELRKLHYVENYDYTVGNIGNNLNISLVSGIFIVTVSNKFDELEKLKDFFKRESEVNKSNNGNVVIYTYILKDKKEFNYLLNRFMSLNLQPNIFEK